MQLFRALKPIKPECRTMRCAPCAFPPTDDQITIKLRTCTQAGRVAPSEQTLDYSKGVDTTQHCGLTGQRKKASSQKKGAACAMSTVT